MNRCLFLYIACKQASALQLSASFLCCYQTVRILFFQLLIIHDFSPVILQPDAVQGKCYRIQGFFTPSRRQLAFPYRNGVPPHSSQFLFLFLVPFFVPSDLRHPEVPVGLGDLTTGRVLDGQWFMVRSQHYPMSMPEASVNKDTGPVFPQDQVGVSRQPFVVQSVSESPFPQPTAHNHLGLRILSPDGSHIGRSPSLLTLSRADTGIALLLLNRSLLVSLLG